MSKHETTALAKRLTIAEVLDIRTRVEAALGDLARAANTLRELAEPIGCNFADITSRGHIGQRFPRRAVDLFSPYEVDAPAAFLRYFDTRAWNFLIDLTGVHAVMNSAKQNELAEQFELSAELPALTAENVELTLRGLVDRSYDMMVDGVVDLIRKISWDYKSNTPCVLTRHFIMSHVLDRHGYAHYESTGVLDDLDRALFVLAGERRPAEYDRWYARIQRVKGQQVEVAGRFFSVRTHKNGNGHITMHDAAMLHVGEINRMISKRFPSTIAPRTKAPRQKRKAS